MIKKTSKSQVDIDAAGRTLGRVASEAAYALRGKLSASFERHKAPDVGVKVVNAGQIRKTAKKMRDTKFAHYSGYPGGLRYQSLAELVAKKGHAAALKETIKGMLPNNKLRPEILKNLIISN